MAYYRIPSVWTWINPYRLNYGSPYPVSKSIRDYFSQDVVGGVDVSLDSAPIGSAKQATPDALTGIDFVFVNGIQVQKTALAGVGFLSQDDLDSDSWRSGIEVSKIEWKDGYTTPQTR